MRRGSTVPAKRRGKGRKMVDELMLANEKWRTYEREYILPSFAFAEAIGFDLRKAVSDNPGKNSVALLVEYLAFRAGYLGFQYNNIVSTPSLSLAEEIAEELGGGMDTAGSHLAIIRAVLALRGVADKPEADHA